MTSYISATLRTLIRQRAAFRCEYCLRGESDSTFPHQPDHIIAEKHGGATDADNLALACAVCNSLKGSDIASIDQESGNIVPLFHPRHEQWSEHFRVDDGRIVPLTSTGRVTECLLQFNRDDLVELRRRLIVQGRYPG